MQRTSESSGSEAWMGSATSATPGASVRSWVSSADHAGSRDSHTSAPSGGASPQYERTLSSEVHAWPCSTSPAGMATGNELLRSSPASSAATTSSTASHTFDAETPGAAITLMTSTSSSVAGLATATG